MTAAEKRLWRLVWIKFKDSFDTSEVSAETIAQLFADFGDFQIQKDAAQSCIINFFQLERDACQPYPASPAGFI